MSIRRYHDMELVITDIDRRQCHRIVPLKLLVLGLGRTGTDCKTSPHSPNCPLRLGLSLRRS